MIATEDALLTYFADLVEQVERFAVTVLPPNDSDEVSLGREDDGALVIDLECRPALARRSADVHIEIFERWSRLTSGDCRWETESPKEPHIRSGSHQRMRRRNLYREGGPLQANQPYGVAAAGERDECTDFAGR